MKVYQYYVHPKMTSYSDEREDRKKEKQNMKPIRFFGWCYLIYTHHSANFNKEIDEEIADSHLLAVYSSKIQKITNYKSEINYHNRKINFYEAPSSGHWIIAYYIL